MTKNFYEDEPLTPTAVKSSDFIAKTTQNKKISKNVLMLLLLLCILLASYFIFQFMTKKKVYDIKAQKTFTNPSDVIENSYVNIEPIVVNLSSDDTKKATYLKLTVVLRVSSDDEAKIVQGKLPMIVDSFQTFLAGLRPIDFNGTGVTLLLKEELTKRVNKLTAPLVVEDVLFKEVIVN